MPERLMPTTWFQASTETLLKLRFGVLMPALFTRMSMRPWRLRIDAAAPATSFWSDTSSAITSALPAALTCFSLLSSVSRLRPEMMTCAPARANSMPPASPMPEPPPVTQATFPFSSSPLGILRRAEEDLFLLFRHFTLPPRVLQHLERALHRGALVDRVAPALERREVVDVHALPLGKAQPGRGRHVGDGVLLAREVLRFLEPPIDHAIEAIRLVGVAL